MKVYKVWKKFRNGETRSHIILRNDEHRTKSEEESWAHEHATNWAEQEDGGQNYGYEVFWEPETDKQKIAEVLENEITTQETLILARKRYILNLKQELKTI